ncbi:hypothetical protein BGX27_001477 [Mortierella sp. AM989]|nr:hypothetical protein BGX27_001477 [Mortierella sp. AM989]
MANASVNEASSGYVVEHPSHKGLDAFFRQQVDIRGTALAVIHGPQALSYAELDRRVSLLVAYLIQRGIRNEEPIGIMLKMSPDQIICQLAVIRAGGTCLPLDPDAPYERIQFMLSDIGACYVLTSTTLQTRILTPYECILVEDFLQPKQQRLQMESSIPTTKKTDLSGADHRTHIFFTSGTTGRPKAVQILARGVIRLTVAPRYFSFTAQERIATGSNPVFDAAQFEVWGALLNGATLVILPKQTIIDPFALRNSLRVQSITTIFLTTALFNQTVFTCPDVFCGIQKVVFGGEAANISAVRKLFEIVEPPRLYNGYGPTECSTLALLHEITQSDLSSETIPIGKPIDNTLVFILDEALRPLGLNQVGEIYIGGDAVARGYWNRPEQNAERFIELKGLVDDKTVRLYRTGDLGSWDVEGVVYFHGRNDNQVKIRGHRIELEEIEAVTVASGFVQEATIMVQETEFGDKYLVGFVVLHEEQLAAAKDPTQVKEKLQQHLEKRLPTYMLPRIVVKKTLPLNRNGKVDRRALLQQWSDEHTNIKDFTIESCFASLQVTENMTNTEALLESMWRRLLDIPSINEHDSFIALGGDSLRASRLALQIGKHLKRPFPVGALYKHPTLSGLAQYIDNQCQGNDDFSSMDDISVLLADVRLPDDIRPLTGTLHPWRSFGRGRVFLTGATGFLGAFFLRDLLLTPDVNYIVCLVRAANESDALGRIRSNMLSYEIWDDAFLSRLRPVAGDLSKEFLGLCATSYSELSKTSDVVFHVGAHVNYIQPYSAHKAANVTGTINVLRFVASGNPKALHYVSTIAAFGPASLLKNTEVVYEDEDLTNYLAGHKYELGYSQSQWVTEMIVLEAQRRGIPLSVYRPGFIMGDSRTGAGNPNDFMARIILGCIAIGAYPILQKQGKQFVTVDYVSQALLRIASDDANLMSPYHLVPPENEELGEFLDLLKNCGHSLSALPYSQWTQHLSSHPDVEKNPLLSLLPMLSEPVYGYLTRWEIHERMPKYDMSNTKRALDASGGLECPRMDQGMLRRYLDFWAGNRRSSREE